MKILLKQVTVADPASPYNGQVRDILIINGLIAQIAENILAGEVDETVTGVAVSPGWVDVFSHFCDPGLEYRETLESGAAAAAAGGFTTVFTLPNTNPVVQSKAQVEYVVQKSVALPVTILPLGTVTRGAEGKELAEMYDMKNSGAAAFSDGLNPVQPSGLMLKALQYVKAFDGVIIQQPVDKSIGAYGLMNEGVVSTRLGLPGMPAIAEELMIHRDIELLKYTGSKLHITGVSTARGLQIIASAKKLGYNVTCSITPYHLFFCDEDLQQYDTNLKVNPPLRTRQDMMALREGVMQGEIDCIASHHIPQNWDAKTCEFEYAKSGMIGLQTAFAAVNTALGGISTSLAAALFAGNARRIFNLPPATVTEGAVAELTLFAPGSGFTLSRENNKSKSFNTPFTGMQLNGSVVAILAKNNIVYNK